MNNHQNSKFSEKPLRDSNPSQAANEPGRDVKTDGTSETNGTRLDEPFPEGPYLGR